MPLPRKGSEGLNGDRSRSPAKSLAASNAGRLAIKADGRKAATTPAPPIAGMQQQQQQQQQQQAPATAADDYAVAVREVLRPVNQLQLSEAELEEEVGRSLTAGNPQAPSNPVRFSYRDRGYRPEAQFDQQLQHLSLGGCLMHCDSDEAARDRQREAAASAAAAAAAARALDSAAQRPASRRGSVVPAADAGAAAADAPEGAAVGPEEEEAAAADEEQEEDVEGSRRLRNQFNFADRAAQTAHTRSKDRSTMTRPPPTATSGGSCSRWDMFEAYLQDQERQRQAEESARQQAQVARRGASAAAAAAGAGLKAAELVVAEKGQGASTLSGGLPGQVVRLVERMVQQNTLREQIMDFRYWDDPADAVKPEEGTLLPLWGEKETASFTSPRVKRRAVTALAWSTRYFDLFAAGYGTFDFLNTTTGLVACYSLKSPGQPERSYRTAAGVMCLDFHPERSNLLAVGCYDGSLAIFDLRAASDQPAYQSSVRSGQHKDPVWQVCWQPTYGHELSLCSISTDGRVICWTISKNEMSSQDVLQLELLKSREERLRPPPLAPAAAAAAGPAPNGAHGQQAGQRGSAARASYGEEEGEGAAGIAGGCCFDFNRQQESLFVVGSEDGSLYKCSTAYASEYLQAYRPGHRLPVYAVRWNGLHSRTFLSAGADWRVKLWDSMLPRPVLSFDLRSPVGDVAWAPFSSTVFAAVTENGKVHVFDLAHTPSAAVCVQRVARKTRLTKLAFNPRHPVLLVGNDQGGVTCLKLSPNLRRTFNAEAAEPLAGSAPLSSTEAAQLAATRAAEADRLEAVLQLAAKCNAALQDEDWELM